MIRLTVLSLIVLAVAGLVSAATYLDSLNAGRELALVPSVADVVLKEVSAPSRVVTKAEPTNIPVIPLAIKKDGHSEVPSVVKKEDPAGGSAYGFRIQIYSSASYDQILVQKKKAENNIDLPIYSGQENGTWKLYAGDYTDRAVAEKDIPIVKQTGYPDAWIVQSRVTVKSK